MLLHPVDWVIIVVYLIGCVIAGVWMKRYVRGVEDFAVAGREMDVYLGVASLAATEMGIVTIMYTAQMGFKYGFAGATPGVLFAVAMFVVGATGFVIKPMRDAGVLTIPELFEKRFGKRVRWLAGLVIVLGGVLNMGIFLRLGGEFLVHVTGMPVESLEWVMTGLLAVVLLYTVLGGMLSVLVTDYLQFLVMGLGIVVTSVLVVWNVGWSDLVAGLSNAYETGAFLLSGVAEPGQDPARLEMANPVNPVGAGGLGWGWVTWQAMLALAAVTTWQTNIARVLSAKDSKTAQKMYRRTAFYFVGRFALPGLWGAAAFLYFLSRGGLPAGINDLAAMPAYLHTILPVGVLGIVIAAMLAAEMSTDSGYLLTWATVIYNDLIMPCLRRPLPQWSKLLIVRLLVLLIGVFLVFYGLWYELPGSAWDYLAVTGTIYLASVFALLVGALYWPRANRWGAMAALILGAVGPISFLVVNAMVEKDSPYQIAPEIAGLSGYVLAFAGMFFGSLLGERLEKRGPDSTPDVPKARKDD